MLFKHLRSMLLVIGVGLLFVISNNQSVLAEGKSVNEDFIDPKVDEVNTKLLELDEKLHELFGEKATISSLGYMTVDEKGIIQVNLKNNFKETAKAIYSSENESNEMIEWMKSQGIVVNNTAKYSSDELTNISDRVMADITSYYNFDLPKDFNKEILKIGIRAEKMLSGNSVVTVNTDIVEMTGGEKNVYLDINGSKCVAKIPLDYIFEI